MRDSRRVGSPMHLPSSRPPRTTSGRRTNNNPAVSTNAKSSSGRDCNASKGSFGLKPQKGRFRGGAGNKNTSSANAVASSNESTGTPSSVHVHHANPDSTSPPVEGYNLTRELSDLSGSYYNGTGRLSNTAANAAAPVLVSADPGGWKHAQVLSSPRLPQHPQPHTDDESSVGLRGNMNNPILSHRLSSKRQFNSAIVDRGEVIEVCIHDTAAASVDDTTTTNNSSPNSQYGNGGGNSGHFAGRTPLILLLMDPNRKLYELLQLWMDSSTDTVRDILQTVNRNLDTNHHNHSHHHSGQATWKQDYDGLFQVRNNHFSQLIHVLQAGKYEVVPGELWVGKPWSMSAKQTVSYASTCLNHLKEIGVLTYRRCSDFAPPAWRNHFSLRSRNSSDSKQRMDDTVLVLSKVAAQRIYVPKGILKHHHACQFLAFVPPLEPSTATDDPAMCVDVLTTDCAVSTASGLSDSHCGSSAAEAEIVEDDGIGVIGTAEGEEDGNNQGASRRDHTERPITSAADDTERGGAGSIGRLNLDTSDFCNKSETEESTYSTAGSQSPIMEQKRVASASANMGNLVMTTSSSSCSKDAASTTSAVTKASAYVLRPHNAAIHHMLPSSNTNAFAQRDPPPGGRGIVRLFSALNCAKQSQHQGVPQLFQSFGATASSAKSPSNTCDLYYNRRSGATARTRLSDDTSTTFVATHEHASMPLYPLWEEDAASQSSGAPLLFSPAREAASSSSANWLAHQVN